MKQALIQGIKHLREEQENLLNKYIGKATEGTIVALLGAYAPEVAILASIVNMAAKGSAGSISGLGSLAETTEGKLGSQLTNLQVSNMINYWNELANIKDSLTAANYQAKMEWFGMGGFYEVVDGSMAGEEGFSFTEIYNPDVIRQMKVWEEEGIAGWMGWDGDMVKKIIAYLDPKNEMSIEELSDYAALLIGGCDIVGVEDMDIFMAKIDKIQKAYLNATKSKGIDLQTQWRYLVNPLEEENDDN